MTACPYFWIFMIRLPRLIVIGDEREAQLDMLRNALASLAGRGSPRTIQFIISCEPQKWQVWVEEKGYSRYCLAVEALMLGVASDWIISLPMDRAAPPGSDQRPVRAAGNGYAQLPALLPYDIRLNFEWMATEGPPAPDLATGGNLHRPGQSRHRPAHAARLHTACGLRRQAADYVPWPAGLHGAQTLAAGDVPVKAGDTWRRFRLPGSKGKFHLTAVLLRKIKRINLYRMRNYPRAAVSCFCNIVLLVDMNMPCQRKGWLEHSISQRKALIPRCGKSSLSWMPQGGACSRRCPGTAVPQSIQHQAGHHGENHRHLLRCEYGRGLCYI
jgi:hypothetical protein